MQMNMTTSFESNSPDQDEERKRSDLMPISEKELDMLRTIKKKSTVLQLKNFGKILEI